MTCEPSKNHMRESQKQTIQVVGEWRRTRRKRGAGKGREGDIQAEDCNTAAGAEDHDAFSATPKCFLQKPLALGRIHSNTHCSVPSVTSAWSDVLVQVSFG